MRSTLDSKQTLQYSALISQLAAKARSVVRELDPQNDLTFLRIRSKKHEIMVAPDRVANLRSFLRDCSLACGTVADQI
ncbi:Dynlrb2 [Symbiodinium pilosum]|uniref:Dynlrb2 protein n=1 Tax=Symbiodinium pilosum TaxID=2952 RepID=A0A812MH80_SYMPI|nr:Dynlrb2 [Symbiodinium pilosum]